MKRYSAWLASASLGFALGSSAFAGSAPVSMTATNGMDNTTIAQLQQMAQETAAEGRNGNKNGAAFQLKYAEINNLIDRLKSGQQVDPSEIDKAMEPVHVW
jgi:hypothetical protein